MQRVLREDHYAAPSGAAYQSLARVYPIQASPRFEPSAEASGASEDGLIKTSTARVDIYRLFVALFGLSIYLGLPAAGLAYLGMQFVS